VLESRRKDQAADRHVVKRIAGGVFGFARLRAGEGCAGAGDVVLLDIPGWDRAALDAAIAQGRPREVKLAKEDFRLPVDGPLGKHPQPGHRRGAKMTEPAPRPGPSGGVCLVLDVRKQKSTFTEISCTRLLTFLCPARCKSLTKFDRGPPDANDGVAIKREMPSKRHTRCHTFLSGYEHQ
jgi:hypothetical protein